MGGLLDPGISNALVRTVESTPMKASYSFSLKESHAKQLTLIAWKADQPQAVTLARV